ncbi:unnamed protein product [Parascedosporium putredinis]|uniref:Indoleamine 2,3-dioxygenase n=1 Tax=Parascedosporium putredinis TaxID=1442378 RepID=A0A9P1MB02_9PEZI|nr:unnamed protein product [Parascedosporium putredinis]CAI7995328.1 unnamed protein product [Parascedosporium putredinis]
MLPAIPILGDYGISPTSGFLPDVIPLTRLPDPYYHKWEAIVAELQALILSRRIRPVVDRLPVLSTIGLEHDAEWRRAYSILCFMAHAYIWGGARSPIIPIMMTAIAAARRDDAKTVTRCLRAFAERLTDLTAILQRIHESCDPSIFYHRIRPFLAGTKNMADAGLPHGVMYEDADGNVDYRCYSGGSNAQSSLIQFFDIILGIQHRPTGEKRPAGPGAGKTGSASGHNFISEMRQYMPKDHARFLNDVEMVANIRDYVESRTDDPDLCLAYDACLAMLSAFRDKHIAIVTRFVVMKAREARARSRSRSPVATRQRLNLATASSRSQQQGPRRGEEPDGAKKSNLTGTGGTALLPFLKQARDETGEPAIAEWTRSFMNKKIKSDTHDEILKMPEQSVPEGSAAPIDHGANGLAGAWELDEEGGGICNY